MNIGAWFTRSETRQHRAPGEMLFMEGEQPAGVYILYSGRIDLLFAARNGKVKPLRVALPGQMLGVSTVVLARPHDCSATTRTACDIGFIEQDEFLGALADNPAIWFSVLRVLSSDVYAVYDDMRTLAVG